MLTDSIPLIIALLSAFVGIAGNTWNKRAKGWRRLTLTGWLVCFLAVGSFVVAVRNTYITHRESTQRLTKEKLLTIQANQDILDALTRFLMPLEQILETAEARPTDPVKLQDYVLSQEIKNACDYLDIYETGAFIERLRQMPAKICPFPEEKDPDCRLDKIVVGYSAAFESKLGDLLSRYQSVLDVETVSLMHQIKNHKMLGIFKATAWNIERNRELGNNVDDITLGWLLFGPHEPDELYTPFLRLLGDLRTHTSNAVRISRPSKEAVFTGAGPKN